MTEILQSTGFAHATWRELVMLGVAGLLLWSGSSAGRTGVDLTAR